MTEANKRASKWQPPKSGDEEKTAKDIFHNLYVIMRSRTSH